VLCKEMDSADLQLFHCEVRWLSRGKVFVCFNYAQKYGYFYQNLHFTLKICPVSSN
jgi:hypothetical protein